MTLFEKRKKRKSATEMLRHSRHFLHMREDLLSARQTEELNGLRSRLRDALRNRDEAVPLRRAGIFATHPDHNIKHPFRKVLQSLRCLAAKVNSALQHDLDNLRMHLFGRLGSDAEGFRNTSPQHASKGLGHLGSTGILSADKEDSGYRHINDSGRSAIAGDLQSNP